MLDDVILDVGAAIGITIARAYTHFPNSKIYGFEPGKRSFGALIDNVGSHPNVELLQVAVDEDETPRTFHESRNPSCSSLLPFTADKTKWKVDHGGHSHFDIIDSYIVPCTRLDNFLKINNINTVKHLKVDAQGADLRVIKSLGNRLKDVETILAEARLTDFHLYEGDCHKDELVQYMKDNGFSIAGSEKQTYDQEENILFKRN